MSGSTSASPRSSFFLLLGGRVSSAVFQAVLLVLLARHVAPSTFGIVGTYTAVVTVLGAVADLGLETAALRSAASGGRDVAEISSLHRRIVGIACVVLLFASVGLATVVPDVLPMLPLALAVWLERRLNLHTGLRIARGESLRVGIVLAAARATSLLSFLVLVEFVASSVLAFSCASVAGAGLGVLATALPLPAAGTTGARELLQRAQPFWRASMSGLLRTLDVPIVQAAAGPSAAGLYALPARAVAPLRLVATSMTTTAIPYAARRDAVRLRDLERLTALCWVVMAAALVVGWNFADELVMVVLGSAYAGAADPLRVLAVGVVVNVPGAFWSGVLQGAGHEGFVAKVGIWLVVLFVPLVAVGALLAGALGAAIGVTTTFIVQMMVFGWRRVRMGAW